MMQRYASKRLRFLMTDKTVKSLWELKLVITAVYLENIHKNVDEITINDFAKLEDVKDDYINNK